MTRDTHVLLIEDNAGDARLVRELLSEAQRHRFALVHVDRVAAGVERLADGGTDVLLLDLSLPDSDGVETVRQVRDHAPAVPVIVLSGTDDEEMATKAVEAGAQDFLHKGGIDARQLERALHYAIERKRADEAYHRSEEQLRIVIANAPIVHFAVDSDGTIALCRGKGLDAVGVSATDLEGKRLGDDVLANAPVLQEHVRMALTGEAHGASLEVRGATFQSYAMPVRDETGKVTRAIGVATDVTERVRAEDSLRKVIEELERRTDDLEAFTYSVSHDLKEPLRTVEAFSQFLLEDYTEVLDEPGKDYLSRLGRASARMKQMIEELLALSRVGRKPDALKPVDVRAVVQEITASMAAAIEERQVRVDVAGGLPEVLGEPSRVRQIFGNLLSNALKFNTNSQPAIGVGVRVEGANAATFIVSDNGIGIEEAYHERIFGVFETLHRREEYDGTGAGLAIVKRAVTALGGRIAVESAPGEGTTFLVTLPIAEPAARVA